MRGGAPLTATGRAARAAFIRGAAAVCRQLAESHGHEAAARRTLAGVHLAVAAEVGVPAGEGVAELAGGDTPVPPERLALPPGVADARLLGEVHEALLHGDHRRGGGSFYTPETLAGPVVGWALDAARAPTRTTPAPVVLDPTVGGGSFLLAAGEALASRGIPRASAVDGLLLGADLDPLAVAVTRTALGLWAGTGRRPPDGAVVVADARAADLASWSAAPADGVDVVVGNPPFLNQLRLETVRGRAAAAVARARFGPAVGAYTDTAALVLLAALHLVRPGGAVAMLQPESFLAARDAAGVRRALLARASLRRLWLVGGGAFDAAVRVCVPVLVRDEEQDEERGPGRDDPPEEGSPVPRPAVRLHRGPRAEPARDAPSPGAGGSGWGDLSAAAAGVPEVAVEPALQLAARCHATAGFRDEYYGLVPFVVEASCGSSRDGGRGAARLAPLVTSGLIDPARCRWGSAAARFARRPWQAPAVDLSRLEQESGLAPWARCQLVPKLLVATQTRVLEAAVDEEGAWLPSTPVISVTCAPGDLWHVAAVLLSPVASAWALRRAGGAALSGDAIKLRARDVLALPVPAEGSSWDRAATAVRRATASAAAADTDGWRAALLEAAEASCRAYGVDGGELVPWWAARLPAWR